MKLVVDANVVISALVADSKTRELIVTLEPELLTPAFVSDEIENYEELIVEKSGMSADRVAQFIDLLFQYIEVVPADGFYPAIGRADDAIGDTDPDDVLYLAWRSPAMRPSGVTIPTSTSRTWSRRTRRVT